MAMEAIIPARRVAATRFANAFPDPISIVPSIVGCYRHTFQWPYLRMTSFFRKSSNSQETFIFDVAFSVRSSPPTPFQRGGRGERSVEFFPLDRSSARED